ncbi:hypothetical protein JM47_00450 [Ureaplasma diversum]|uniref:GIY-YIG domain-containing protein n=1 Tax=Ureaplasma diversum TaxID=42094 RepID=A0A0C5RNS6_9BACT|nr:GIY-YIG nuclease family protein [Ureaplasma diversum]AJQ45129.1 hypothetical protein JM47_00450 [Ureaplasma diversum]
MNTQLIKEFYETLINQEDQLINDKACGIYVLYIKDHNYNNNIIPIYIGQSKNIKARYLSHKNELKYLINLYLSDHKHHAFYEHYELNKQDGKHLYSKMFSYLVKNNLNIDHLKIKVIELCDEADLDQLEYYYINQYRSDLFGFNQLFFISQCYVLHFSEAKLLAKTKIELNKLLDYGLMFLNQFDQSWLDYGYADFNFYHFIKFADIEIKKFINAFSIRNGLYSYQLLEEFIYKLEIFKEYYLGLNRSFSFGFEK